MDTSVAGSAQTPATRVSTLELFFDLVFVFTITQVSDLILHAGSALAIGHAVVVLAIIWWMYGGYAWLTNNVGTTQPLNQLLVLTAMAGFLVMALAVPHAFDRDGLAFGLAYLLVNIIHAALFTRAPSAASAQAIWQVAPFNIGTALLVVVAGIVGPPWNWFVWLSAVAVLAGVPLLRRFSGFEVQPAHFVERHGLVVIIALGESIVSIGVGAAGEPVTLTLVTAAVLTLALNAALWWSYFSQDDQLAEHALASVQGHPRARMALYAFGYAHLISDRRRGGCCRWYQAVDRATARTNTPRNRRAAWLRDRDLFGWRCPVPPLHRSAIKPITLGPGYCQPGNNPDWRIGWRAGSGRHATGHARSRSWLGAQKCKVQSSKC